jgi:hypothetical protein
VAETAFLTAVQTYLGLRNLTPAPKSIGIVEPEDASELPAVVLSLDETARAGTGLGEKTSLITDGILEWQATIDLANPVLPEEPTFRLLSDDRTVLTLPHGGLIKSDGTPGPLTSSDLTVSVGGTNRVVVITTPIGTTVQGDPVTGQLTFGSALPLTGNVQVTYFLGQWERRVTRITGVLRVDVFGANSADVSALTNATTEALLLPRAKTDIRNLLALNLISLSSVAPRATSVARRRSARFAFSFEHVNDEPDSSGGIIRLIPVTTRLSVASVDAAGAVHTTITTIIE